MSLHTRCIFPNQKAQESLFLIVNKTKIIKILQNIQSSYDILFSPCIIILIHINLPVEKK